MMLRAEPTGDIDLSDIYEMTNKYMKMWNCDCLFVAAEFQERVEEFAGKISNTTY